MHVEPRTEPLSHVIATTRLTGEEREALEVVLSAGVRKLDLFGYGPGPADHPLRVAVRKLGLDVASLR